MSDTEFKPPVDPFAGSINADTPPVSGADINAAHAEHLATATAFIAEAQQAIEGILKRVPTMQGNKSMAAVSTALGSVRTMLTRAMDYQKELAAFLPPPPATEPEPVPTPFLPPAKPVTVLASPAPPAAAGTGG